MEDLVVSHFHLELHSDYAATVVVHAQDIVEEDKNIVLEDQLPL
jgi:hypothetical protein